MFNQNCDDFDRFGRPDPEKYPASIKIFNNPSGPLITSELEITSSPEPIRYYNPVSAGVLYVAVSGTTSTNDVVPLSSVWFANDTSAKDLVYANPILPEDLTRFSYSEEEEPQLLYGTGAKYKQIFHTIGQLVNLKDNWDSYGGNTIEERCIMNALEIIQYLLELNGKCDLDVPAPFVAPLSSGGIQIEWEEGDRYLQIDLLPDSSNISYFVMDKTNSGFLTLEGLMKSLNNLKELLTWFMEGETKDLSNLYLSDYNLKLAA